MKRDESWWDERTEKVTESGCWIWMLSLSKNGYGRHSLGERSLHRRMWIETHGPIPNGLFVLHSCDIRCCVNPDHLYLGTQTDNMFDRARRGRKSVASSGSAAGISNPDAGKPKLNEKAVAEIRASRDTLRSLGEQYGVCKYTIWQIRNGRSWKHVA